MDGSFIVYEREIGQKMGEKTRENARKPSKMQKKSARQFYQNHRADLVRVFITDLILRHSAEVVEAYSQSTENACVYKEFCNTKGI